MNERVGESEAILPPSQQTTGLRRESRRGGSPGGRRAGEGEQGGRRRYLTHAVMVVAHDSLALGFLQNKFGWVMWAQNLSRGISSKSLGMVSLVHPPT